MYNTYLWYINFTLSFYVKFCGFATPFSYWTKNEIYPLLILIIFQLFLAISNVYCIEILELDKIDLKWYFINALNMTKISFFSTSSFIKISCTLYWWPYFFLTHGPLTTFNILFRGVALYNFVMLIHNHEHFCRQK